MNVNINKNTKTIFLWLTKEEYLTTNPETKYKNYLDNKYKLCIFISGKENLNHNLLNLLSNYQC